MRFDKKKIIDLITDPNNLTLARVAVVPLIVVLLLWPNRVFTLLAAFFFSAAAITDYFDGYYARERGLVTNFGKMMDPLADKLMVASTLIMLVSHGWVPAWMICIIIGRELAVTGLRAIIADKGEDASASMLGKYKTGFQIAAIIPLLIHYPYFGIHFNVIGTFFSLGSLDLYGMVGSGLLHQFQKTSSIMIFSLTKAD